MALFKDPSVVLQSMRAAKDPAAKALARGLGIQEGATNLIKAVPDAVRSGGRLVDRVLKPSALGAPVQRGLSAIGGAIQKRPGLMAGGLAAAGLGPILLNSFNDTRARNENELMSFDRDPGRVVTAGFMGAAKTYLTSEKGHDAIGKGIIGGVGKGLVEALIGGVGSSFAAAHNALFNVPKRKKLLEDLIAHDQIISDAVKRNPHVGEQVMSAYATMCRFAPSLSLDPNAARSFLREAVMGGAGVSYAVVKNLAETEKAISGDRR